MVFEYLKPIFQDLLNQSSAMPSSTLAREPVESSPRPPPQASPLTKLESRLCRTDFARIQSELSGYGPLTPLLGDPEVSEIIVNSDSAIWYEKQGQLNRYEDGFLSAISYRNILQRILGEAQTQLNVDHPFADGHWRSFRLHAVSAPVAPNLQICLRRHPENPWSLEQLAQAQWASPGDLQILKKCLEQRQTLLIVGPTGSGKTSVLNACLQALPENERCVLIEDTLELHPPNPVSTRLLTRSDPQKVLSRIDQNDLVKQALRMRPDRLILGEIRGAEAKDLLMAFSTGHSGGMATLHAEHPRQALIRLEMLVQLGSPQWQLQAIRQLIRLSLSHIIVTARGRQGHRHLQGIYRISSLEENGFTLEPVTDQSLIRAAVDSLSETQPGRSTRPLTLP